MSDFETHPIGTGERLKRLEDACERLSQLLRMTVPIPAGCIAPAGTPMSPDFRVAVQLVANDSVHFIIHPSGHSGDTLDLVACPFGLAPLAPFREGESQSERVERTANSVRPSPPSAKTRTLPMTSKTDGPIEVRDEHGNPIASTEPRASLLSVEELTEQRIREGHIRFADDTDLGSVQRFIEHLERSAGSEGVHIDAEECAAFARDLRDALAPKMKLYHLLERCVSFFGSDPPRVYVRRFISEIRDVLTETATLRPSEDDR